MQPWPDTSETLITRLQNPADRQAWSEFACLYEPLIFRFATRSGLQEPDAEDITNGCFGPSHARPIAGNRGPIEDDFAAGWRQSPEMQ